jgi:hypothetical protein
VEACRSLSISRPLRPERLQAEAERLGISPAELARAAVTDLLAAPDNEFTAAVKRVLERNRELYRRLA